LVPREPLELKLPSFRGPPPLELAPALKQPPVQPHQPVRVFASTPSRVLSSAVSVLPGCPPLIVVVALRTGVLA
jgi:hypothetical protein